MSNRRNRQRRLTARADLAHALNGPHMDIAHPPQMSIDDLPTRYRELAKHASAVLHYDGLAEERADTLAAGSVLALLLRLAGLTAMVGTEPPET